MGKLEVCNMPSCQDFTLMEFPKTYFDSKCTQRLVLRNNSAARTVFCVLFNNDEKPGEEDTGNKCFSVSPMDGRLEPKEARIFTIEYKPTCDKSGANFHFAVVTFKRLNFWKDMNVSDYPKGLYTTLREYKGPEIPRRKTIMSLNAINSSEHNASIGYSFSNPKGSYHNYISFQEMLLNQPLLDLENRINVCLHGEPELVNTTCAPDEFNMPDLVINNPVDRVINIANKSQYLSIKFAYEKVAYINILPKSGTLKANSSVDVKVTINVSKLGKIFTNILFLLYNNTSAIEGVNTTTQVGKITLPVMLRANYPITKKPSAVKVNTGITPTFIKEVGTNADLVAYNRKDVVIPRQTMDPVKRRQRRDDTAFIAFPNDRPSNLRPWTSKLNPVETIYAKIPRGIVSSQSLTNIKNELVTRHGIKEFYANYLRHPRMALLKALNNDVLPEYEVTKTRQFLMHKYFTDFLADDLVMVTSKADSFDPFIPLTPSHLNKIKIYPGYVCVGLVAPYSRSSSSFSITNDNDVAIRVYIVPEKQRFTFLHGEGVVVKAQSSRNVDFTFFSEYEGTHNICINIVINECHIFEVTVYANVVAKRLLLCDQKLFFEAEDPPYKFVNLFNPLNVDIDYIWLPTDSNFVIEPHEGKIPPLQGMACLITYDPLRNKSNQADLIFHTTPLLKQRCCAIADPPQITTSVCELDVNFGLVPMNARRTKRAVLWNTSNCSVSFTIRKPDLMPGMQILPDNGFLKSKNSQIITFKLKTLNCAPFAYIVNIYINDRPTHEMTIKGNVIFPIVKYSPNPYKIKRFPVTSFASFTVNVENKTETPIIFAFNFNQCMHCYVTDRKDGDRFVEGKITLEAKQIKTLYFHFDPKDVTSLWFNMPFILNDVLGPPIGSFATASKTATYMRHSSYKVNPTMSIMRVFTIISESDFKVSKYWFRFYYHPYDSTRNICEDRTTFTNTSEKELEFCIRLETVNLPFQISSENESEVHEHSSSITFILQPGDSTTLIVKFVPQEYGSFSNTAGFYVRDDYQSSVHNFLFLNAVYEVPALVVPETVYLEFIPLKYTYEKSIYMHANNHSDKCVVRAESSNNNLQVLLKYQYRTEMLCQYEVCLTYMSYNCETLKNSVIFTCTCGGHAAANIVGVAENSLFTTFKVAQNVNESIKVSQTQSRLSITSNNDDTISHIVAKEFSTFPYFPEDGDDDYNILLETLNAVESWIFSQGFGASFRFKIPDSFTMLTPLPRGEGVDYRKKTKVQLFRYIIPYTQLLKHITSRNIAEQIGLSVSYKNEENLTKELYCLYQRVLQFLKEMGAHLPHVEPENLLGYEQYITYITKFKNDRTMLAEKPICHVEYNFYLLSKQAWLDVILQTLKIFVVGRINIRKDSIEVTRLSSSNTIQETVPATYEVKKQSSTQLPRAISQTSIGFFEKIHKNDFSSHHFLSTNEYYLLSWIKHYYMLYIGEICPENLLTLMLMKEVDDYDSCFKDGLVFATIMAAHCPYLKYGLNGMYWIPTSTEQFHHNAAVIVQALNIIHSTFEIMPRNIYNPNHVQMILLTAYLHEFLPNLYPRNTIKIRSQLSKTSYIKITIYNENNFDVNYRVLFFENEHRCFKETTNIVTVPARSTQFLDVIFQARFIRRVSSVLVLCGEVAGKKSAKSIAYKLIGKPDVTHVPNRFLINTKYYTTDDHLLEVVSPYKTSGCYDIFVTYNQPTSYKDLKLIDYFSVIRDRILMKFNFPASQAMFNANGISNLIFKTVSLVGKPRGGWIFFRNATIGDFCIYIEMQIMPTKQAELIYVNIPNKIYSTKCVCAEKGQKHCMKFVMLKVPKTNVLLLESFKREFIKLKSVHLEFWTAYLEKPSALRHMKKMYANKDYCTDILNVLNILTDEKKFDVSIVGIGKEEAVTFPKTLTITTAEYGNLEEFVPFNIHVGDHPLHNFQLLLFSKIIMEYRRYKVIVS